jgi:copper chaperone NosL
MSRFSRLLIAVAGVLLGGMLVFPLWSIGLIAPQYPEGLGMVIGIHTITGQNPQDLNNINELNHYIGMKVIDPTSIPELRVMPWIVGALILLALVAGVWGKRSLVIGWLVGLSVLGTAGLVDFWRWTYDFGHNLDVEHAIIKMPGTVYQPPILGSKQILNFTATSWPSLGAWLAVAAFVAGVIALVMARRGTPRASSAIGPRHTVASSTRATTIAPATG